MRRTCSVPHVPARRPDARRAGAVGPRLAGSSAAPDPDPGGEVRPRLAGAGLLALVSMVPVAAAAGAAAALTGGHIRLRLALAVGAPGVRRLDLAVAAPAAPLTWRGLSAVALLVVQPRSAPQAA